MADQDRPGTGNGRRPQYFDWMIPLAGITLILLSTAMFGLLPGTPNNIVMAIALFGVGCAALWFGLFHADVHRSSDRIERIREKTDKVEELIQKSRK